MLFFKARSLIYFCREYIKYLLSKSESPSTEFEKGFVMPPAYFRWLVIGSMDPQIFYDSGKSQAEFVKSSLKDNSVEWSKLVSVLDFGTGCGRVLQHLSPLSDGQITACDIQRGMIRWNKKHFPNNRYYVTPLRPPISKFDEKFDLILLRSVFTHLPIELQKEWLAAFRNMLVQHGMVWITLSGSGFQNLFTDQERTDFSNGKLVVRQAGHAGSNYCAVFHPRSFAESLFRENGFQILDFWPGHSIKSLRQDTYLLRVNHST